MLHVGLYITYKFKSNMNFVIMQNAPQVPYPTVVNTALICKYPRNWELKHKEKGISSITGKWYFVMQESAAYRLTWVNSELTVLSFLLLPPLSFFLTSFTPLPPISDTGLHSYRLLRHKLRTEACKDGRGSALGRWRVVHPLRLMLMHACWWIMLMCLWGYWKILQLSFSPLC